MAPAPACREPDADVAGWFANLDEAVEVGVEDARGGTPPDLRVPLTRGHAASATDRGQPSCALG